MPVLYGFPAALGDLSPGGQVIVFGSWDEGLEGRRRGLELRDTLLVLGASGPPRFAFLFRAGLEGTVAETVLKYGTGGLNIDTCRVGLTKRVPGGLSRTPGQSLSGSVDGSLRRETGEEGGHNPNVGRWPTNMVFVHSEGCKREGVKRIRGGAPTPSGFDRYNKALSEHGYRPGEYQKGSPPSPPSRVDASGQETIPNWVCVDGCSVRALDEQARIHPGGSRRGYEDSTAEPGFTGGWSEAPYSGMRYGDSGGASRFFPQFENESALVTWLKALIGET